MARDNAYNQSEVAYGSGPKEVADHEPMPSDGTQFGKHKMPQDEKLASKGFVKKAIKSHEKSMHRHKEHR